MIMKRDKPLKREASASKAYSIMTIVEQIEALPRKRANNDSGMLGISKELLGQLRQVAARHNASMGRVAEIAIERLLADIKAETESKL
jgi:hypothetical protein